MRLTDKRYTFFLVTFVFYQKLFWNYLEQFLYGTHMRRVKPIISYFLYWRILPQASKPREGWRDITLFITLNLEPRPSKPLRNDLASPPCDRSEKAGERERRSAPSNAISSYFYFPLRMRGCTPVHAHQVGSSVKRPAIIADIDLRYIVYGLNSHCFSLLRFVFSTNFAFLYPIVIITRANRFFSFQIQDFIT